MKYLQSHLLLTAFHWWGRAAYLCMWCSSSLSTILLNDAHSAPKSRIEFTSLHNLPSPDFPQHLHSLLHPHLHPSLCPPHPQGKKTCPQSDAFFQCCRPHKHRHWSLNLKVQPLTFVVLLDVYSVFIFASTISSSPKLKLYFCFSVNSGISYSKNFIRHQLAEKQHQSYYLL